MFITRSTKAETKEKRLPVTAVEQCCPACGYHDLDPRRIFVGFTKHAPANSSYQEIFTLKCQNCGWLGEQLGAEQLRL